MNIILNGGNFILRVQNALTNIYVGRRLKLSHEPIFIEELTGKGYEVKIYDKNVSISKLIGKNKSVIELRLPHLSQLLQDDLAVVTDWADVLVVATKEEEFRNLKTRKGQVVYDMVRLSELEALPSYEGLCW